MLGSLLSKVLATTLSRWVTVGVVTALLSSAVFIWHRHNENLREEGAQECVQEINRATMEALEDALAAERAAGVALRASLAAAVAANQEAIERREAAESTIESLRESMERQRNEDPTYREWSDTALPDGVADRLRQAAGSAPSDSN